MYSYQTKIGVFYIIHRNGRWLAMYEDENLGGYISPQQAADDLSGGHTLSLSNGIDTSTLGIPEDISEWSYKKS
jgi:hypothetical protein